MSLFGKPVGYLWNITVNIVAAQPKETDNHMLSGYSFLTTVSIKELAQV